MKNIEKYILNNLFFPTSDCNLNNLTHFHSQFEKDSSPSLWKYLRKQVNQYFHREGDVSKHVMLVNL